MNTKNYIHLLFLIMLIAGCSKSESPVTVDGTNYNSNLTSIIDVSHSGENHSKIGLMGAWELSLSSDGIKADLVAKRSTAIGESYIISGMSYFTMAPCSSCLKLSGIELLSSGKLKAIFNIKHPFQPGDPLKPPSGINRLDLDIFDLALVVHPQNSSSQSYSQTGKSIYTDICVDADGYTTEMSNLIDDQSAIPYYLVIDDSHTGESTYNRFEMGAQAEFDVKFNVESGTVFFDLYLTMGYGASAIRPQRLEPKYFNPEFNRKSAWKIDVISPGPAVEGSTWDDTDSSTTYDVIVRVYDWQQGATVYGNPIDFQNAPNDNVYASSNVASVSVEIPGMTLSLSTATSPDSGDGTPSNPLEYIIPIANENLLMAGDYTGLVKVLDERIPASNYMTENRDFLINSPNGIELDNYLLTEYAVYQTFTATVVETGTVGGRNLMWAKNGQAELRAIQVQQ